MSDRAVFDCMIFLQATTNEKSPAFACFELVDSEKLTLCVSPQILEEVSEVLQRPKLQAKFPNLTPARTALFLQNVRAKAIMASDVPKVFTYPRDTDDEPYVNLAIVTAAKFLVSRDKDLLDLMNDADFRTLYPSLTILDPVALLNNYRSV
jgi:putative PIN family toxin of toxin-antitoxin system